MSSSSEPQNDCKFSVSLGLTNASLTFSATVRQPIPMEIMTSHDTLEKSCIAMDAIRTLYLKFGNSNESNWDVTLTVTENGALRHFGNIKNEDELFSKWHQKRHEFLDDKTKRTVYQIALPNLVFDPTRSPPLVPVPKGEIDPDSLLTFYETLEDAIVARDAIAAMHGKVGGLVGQVEIIVDTDPGRFYTRIYPDPDMNGEEMKPDTENLSRYDPDGNSAENKPDSDDLSNDSPADGPGF